MPVHNTKCITVFKADAPCIAPSNSEAANIIEDFQDYYLDSIIGLASEANASLIRVDVIIDDQEGTTTWALTFKSKEITSISEIDGLYLKPLSITFDMNHIDQTFDLISVAHNREEDTSIIKINIVVCC